MLSSIVLTPIEWVEGIAAFVAWILVSRITSPLKRFVPIPPVLEGAILWVAAWFAQTVIVKIVKSQAPIQEKKEKAFAAGPGLKVLRSLYCERNPLDEDCWEVPRKYTPSSQN